MWPKLTLNHPFGNGLHHRFVVLRELVHHWPSGHQTWRAGKWIIEINDFLISPPPSSGIFQPCLMTPEGNHHINPIVSPQYGLTWDSPPKDQRTVCQLVDLGRRYFTTCSSTRGERFHRPWLLSYVRIENRATYQWPTMTQDRSSESWLGNSCSQMHTDIWKREHEYP